MNWIKEQESINDKLLSMEDKLLYEKLIKELKNTTEIDVPENFAVRVAGMQSKKDSLWSDIKLYGFYSIFFIVLIGICTVFFLFDTSPNGVSTVKLLLNYFNYFILGSLIYFTIQSLDRILLKSHQSTFD